MGSISAEEYADRVAARLGIDGTRVLDALARAYAGSLNTRLVAQLQAIRARVTVAALTNNWSFLDRLLEHHGIADLFHVVINSADVQCRKPDRRIYEILLDRLAVRADDVLFFDDDPANVAAADALGFRAVHFTVTDSAVAAIASLTALPQAARMVRPATVADATRIADLQLASWRATYATELSAEFREAQDSREWAADWRSEIANGVNVLVVEEGDVLLGFVACGNPRRGSAGIVGWEIYNIHAHPEHHGEGIGGTLFRAAVDLGRVHGARQLVLWVVRTNHSARAFYERRGMRVDGAEQLHRVGNETLSEIRYRLMLPDGTP